MESVFIVFLILWLISMLITAVMLLVWLIILFTKSKKKIAISKILLVCIFSSTITLAGSLATSTTHEHSWEVVVTTDATCTEHGVKIKKCTICDEVTTELIEASHDWVPSDEENKAVCTRCNELTIATPSLFEPTPPPEEPRNEPTNTNPEPLVRIMTIAIILAIGAFASLPVLIVMAILKSVEKKKAEKEQNARPATSRQIQRPTPTPPVRSAFPEPEVPIPPRPVRLTQPTVNKIPVVQHTQSAPKANYAEGERRGNFAIYDALRDRESFGAKFIFNVQLPAQTESAKIDVVMIDPYGLFVFASEQGQNNEQTLVEQNTRAIQLLKPYIEIRDVPFHNLVVLSGAHNAQDGFNYNPYVVTTQTLRDKVQELSYKHSLCLLSSDINQIYQKLLPYAQVTKI